MYLPSLSCAICYNIIRAESIFISSRYENWIPYVFQFYPFLHPKYTNCKSIVTKKVFSKRKCCILPAFPKQKKWINISHKWKQQKKFHLRSFCFFLKIKDTGSYQAPQHEISESPPCPQCTITNFTPKFGLPA